MLFKHLLIKFLFLIAAILLLQGCTDKESPEEKINQAQDKIVKAEKEIDKQQNRLMELEAKEKQLYDRIIHLSMKEYSTIVKLSDEAIAAIHSRSKSLDQEDKIMRQSKKAFGEMKEPLSALQDNGEEKLLYAAMQDRYKAHDKLVDYYRDSILQDIRLYEMFKEKNLKFEELQSQINKINQLYEKVRTENERFNKLTEEYNYRKQSLLYSGE
ncbi:septal ring factor EnvC (AmiA/AmiB activator) [Peribacillus deserti]|uniref:Septal ring factor EnvC (AmiA/AmiB activator) n=1 Tax=Peribacillus deserti TaxID=673318 RepID=A0ABS2QI90_9BACI|nr:YkyA family protein [Peribacillus deserti]MBM7692434.1 septal ring factor EnvC (AmiA/AmiB activator) [Peribacillus deserti]